MLKKGVGLLSLCLVSPLFAGTMGTVAACKKNEVRLPCEREAVFVAGDGLYLQAVDKIFTSSPSRSTYPRWGWGFKVEAGYEVPKGTDAAINWSSYRKITNSTATVPRYYRPRYDQVNMEIGQRVILSERASMRIMGGGEYAHIKQEGTNAAATNTTWHSFNGGGFRAGIDGLYTFDSGIGVFMDTALAVIFGRNQDINAAPSRRFTAWTMATNKALRVGINFSHEDDTGRLTLEGGWRMMQFADIANRAATFAVRNRTTANATNFSMQGFFVGGRWTNFI